MKHAGLAVAAVLLGALLALQGVLERTQVQRLERASQNLGELRASSLLPTYIGSLFLGSFRAVAIDVLWIQMHRMGEEEHRYFERVEIMDLITKLQPRNPEAWAYQGWDAAYNIANQFRTEEEEEIIRRLMERPSTLEIQAHLKQVREKMARKEAEFRKWIQLGLLKLAEGSRHLPDDAYLQYEIGRALRDKASWAPGIMEEQFLRAVESDDTLQKVLGEGLAPGVRRTSYELADAWMAKGKATLERLIQEGRFRVYRTLAETMSRPPEEDRQHQTTQMGLNIDVAAFVGAMQDARYLNGILLWKRARTSATAEAAQALFKRAAASFRGSAEQSQLYREKYSAIKPGLRAYHDARADLCRGLAGVCEDLAARPDLDRAELLARLERVWWPDVDRNAAPTESVPPADDRHVLDILSELKKSLGGDGWEYNDERQALHRGNLLFPGDDFEASIGPTERDIDWYHGYLAAPAGSPEPGPEGLDLSATFIVRRISGGPLHVETLGIRRRRPEVQAYDVTDDKEIKFTVPLDREGQVFFLVTSPQAGTVYRVKVPKL